MTSSGAGRPLQDDSGEAGPPPGYDEVISSTRFPVLRTAASDAGGRSPEGATVSGQTPKWKLKFVDFTPHFTNINPRRTPTTFEQLIQRANTWLQCNKTVDVISCETITWCAEDIRQLNNTDIVNVTIRKGNVKKLYFMRGLRIWLSPRRVSSNNCITLSVREFTPQINSKKDLINFDINNLVSHANQKISENPIPGRILTINTTLQPTEDKTTTNEFLLRSHDTYWIDGAKTNRKYIPIIRIFYALDPRNTSVQIGLRDIYPRVITKCGRKKHENLEMMMSEVNDWIDNQTDIKITNIQSVTYRKQGFAQGVGFPVLWATPDAEETSLRCIRIAYTKPQTALSLRVPSTQRYHIQKRTFAPRRCRMSGDSLSGSDLNPDREKYQSLTQTVNEMSHWLEQNDVKVLCVETLRQQIDAARHTSSSDSSLVRASDEKIQEFVTLVRIFIKVSNYSDRPQTLYNALLRRTFQTYQNSPDRRMRKRRWRHVIVILVIIACLVIGGAVVLLVLAVGRRWI